MTKPHSLVNFIFKKLVPIVEWFHWRHKKFTLHWLAPSYPKPHLKRENSEKNAPLLLSRLPSPSGAGIGWQTRHSSPATSIRDAFSLCLLLWQMLPPNSYRAGTKPLATINAKTIFIATQTFIYGHAFKALQKSPHPRLQISSRHRHRHGHGLCSRFNDATNCNKYMNLLTPYMLLFCVSCRLVGGMDGRFFELDVEGFLNLLLHAHLFLCTCFVQFKVN